MGMYCGIDLHATNSWLCVVDEEGRPQLEARVANRVEAVCHRLEPYREQLHAVAVESTFNWYWLVDGLESAGYSMRLANPAAMGRKGDSFLRLTPLADETPRQEEETVPFLTVACCADPG